MQSVAFRVVLRVSWMLTVIIIRVPQPAEALAPLSPEPVI